jgi:hypothetical protein
MAISGGSESQSVQAIINSPGLREAVLQGDPAAVTQILRKELGHRLAQDLNKNLGRDAFNANSLWATLVNPQWIDLAQKLLALNPNIIALTLAREVLSVSSVLDRAERAKTIRQNHLPDQLGLSYESIPALFDLGFAKSEDSKQKQNEILIQQQQRLSQDSASKYNELLSQMTSRARRHKF